MHWHDAGSMAGMPVLSCILPVALHEPGIDRKTWRHSPDDGAYVRTRLMLRSFLHLFRQDDLDRFLLVCPEQDVAAVTGLLHSLTDDPRYQVIPENVFCPGIVLLRDKKTGIIPGWYAQQLIKLAAAQHIQSAYYITFDSDIICTRPFSYASLVPQGRALLNIETPADYERLYTATAAAKEVAIRKRRFKGCRKLLGGRRPRAYIHRYYGETPVILHTPSVRSLCEHISTTRKRSWQAALAENLCWTEYCLYFQYLEMNNAIDKVYQRAGCNAVLDWENSIWHISERYRLPRDYAHWPPIATDHDRGCFVAVQSRLDATRWLPDGMSTPGAFYAAIEQRLFPCPTINAG